ncbi:pentatricopeptide repeat-containing protein At4g33990 [Lotus japonicus]|uniref:pentatricopeptide repeat-containing protein At4g33990 n=1 Tax=Lotus japonicus TaxID=34305 RepID=UPI00258B0C73|nr:pentatricopeptide repeat-containing protein At4g33990 [Lotus japonicus]XP_057429697.1 pentatricopeptide repeat-containing protein At4g33990 [Lotus japonicus]XP_057429698.1 pentatricopeptide repeat-containing protein At4g33990 [Lotus japonicus]XP_057429699.1 pentatricopeptide repeat-containing protein At4g33990 [Lotus japonicus]XP_057429701.1 pentatricopeptide repeat-containing protein At4g33990 [Lotus japonicus]
MHSLLKLLPTCKLKPSHHHRWLHHSLPTASPSLQSTTSRDFHNNQNVPDIEAFFHSCTNIEAAKQLHARLVVLGQAQNVIHSTKLINLYAALGYVSLSRCTFNHTQKKNIYSWNSIIAASTRCGRYHEAMNYVNELLSMSCLRPDFYTFPPVLKACVCLPDGKKIHCWVFKMGFEHDVFVAASLIHFYSRFGDTDVAHQLFVDMPVRDVGSWNAMISGFCQNGNAAGALRVLNSMKDEGVKMDTITVTSVLPICAQSEDIISGLLIHLYVIKHGLERDVFVSNALINMYSKFGRLQDAQRVFDHMSVRDLVSWNSIVAAYEQNNDPTTALGFFKEMQLVGIRPDLVTVVSLASIFGQLSDQRVSRSLHGFVVRRGWLEEDVQIGNALVNMYAKLGAMNFARTVFEQLPIKDVISWNTLISGYGQNGLASEAIDAYNMMEESTKIIPNHGTWVSILPAYSTVGALPQGMKIHGRLIKNSHSLDVFVATCLIDMYGKCGRLDDAMSLFNEIPRETSVTWNTMISSLGIHGRGEEAMRLFKNMRAEGVKADHITFVSLLSACSHSGLVDEGQHCFDIMQKEYGVMPTLKHYGCIVDILGRAGYLEKAYNLVSNMPLQADASIWGALLAACRIHGNAELGAIASDRLLEVDSENVGYYVLLSNIYANVGKWEGVVKVRSLARNRGLRKTPGWSSVVVGSLVEVFYTGNQTHPQWIEIYEELRVLNAKMKSLGYIPDFSFVLQDVEEDEKEQILTSHSERLAIAYGIISTPPKTPIRIFKNLRVCGDCHNATKYISRITERDIVVRDSYRFHHFKDGICSCGDYW